MVRFFSPPFSELPKLTITSALDILIVAVLIYQFLMIIRGRRAVNVLFGVCILGLIYLAAIWAKLEILRTILATLAPYTAIALIVMFQTELRRTLARLGRKPFLGSQIRAGALIVVERKIGLRTFSESGANLDAAISRDLLCAIFQPGGSLHDGAVIIQGDRIAAAACFLPLTTSTHFITELGTRHRAGLGITEESDCLAVIVSETGRISIAAFGEIELNVSIERVSDFLTGRLDRRDMRSSPAVTHSSPAVREYRP